jgi:hypothetical protein
LDLDDEIEIEKNYAKELKKYIDRNESDIQLMKNKNK